MLSVFEMLLVIFFHGVFSKPWNEMTNTSYTVDDELARSHRLATGSTMTEVPAYVTLIIANIICRNTKHAVSI